jgi:hypothetical protein
MWMSVPQIVVGGDSDQRAERSDIRDQLLIEYDASWFDEDRGLHFSHELFLIFRTVACARRRDVWEGPMRRDTV